MMAVFVAGLAAAQLLAADAPPPPPPRPALRGLSTEVRRPFDGFVDRWVTLDAKGQAERFEADFIRADVTIQPSPSGTIEMKVDARSASIDLVRVVVLTTWLDGTIKLTDIYPPRSSWTVTECSPPIDERGDFWTIAIRPTITLRLPNSMPASIRLRDGQVHDQRAQATFPATQ